MRRDRRCALVVRARASAAEVALAEQVVDDSGVADELEQLLDEARTNGAGRPRELPVRAVLVALVVLAMSGQPLHLRRVAELLANLPAGLRRRLGVDRDGRRRITERQVDYIFGRIRAELDCSPHTTDGLDDAELAARRDRLQAISDALLAATLPDQRQSGSYALDATTLAAWARGYRIRHNWRDRDAGWSVKDTSGSTALDAAGGDSRPRGSKAIFGYDVHLLCWVRDDDQDTAPPAVVEKLVAFGGGRSDIDRIADLVCSTVADPVADQPVGDVLADRWYSQQLPGRFTLPVRRAGAHLVIDQRSDHAGTRGTHQGALNVDGRLYCPAMSDGLHELPKADFRNIKAVHAREKVAARRKPWELLPLAAEDDQGYQRMQCPSARGKVRCPLKPGSMAASPATSHTVFDPPDAPGKCCTQQSVTVAPSVLGRLKQKHPWGTKAWRRSYNRRNVVEGVAGMLKTAGGGDVKRDHIRVMGLVATTLLVTVAVAAMNLHALAAHERREQAAAAEQAERDRLREDGYDQLIALDRTFAVDRKARQAAEAVMGGTDPPGVG